MVGFSIRVEVTGLDEARRIAKQVENLGEETEPLLRIAGSVLEASVLSRFDTGRGPGGVPWPPSKRVLKAGGKTLVDKANLEGSIRHVVRPGEVEIGVDARSESAKWGFVHQFGSNRQTVVVGHTRVVNQAFGVPLPSPVTATVRPHGRITNIPARPFLGIDDDDRRELTERWHDHLKGLFNRAS